MKYSWEHESIEFAAKLKRKADAQRKTIAESQRKQRAGSQQKKKPDSRHPAQADSWQPNVMRNPYSRVLAEIPLSELAHEKLFQIGFVVRGLRDEYKYISHNINRRLPKDLPVHIRRVTRASRVHRFVTNESPATPRPVVSEHRLLPAQIERFLYVANTRAFEIYGLHVTLRLRLGKMIMRRRRPDAQRWLATHLIELRCYNEDLYYRKRAQPKQQIARKLLALELRNAFQRTKVLPRVPSAMPLIEQRKGLKPKRNAISHRKLSVRYRRLRRSSTVTLPTSTPMRMRRQIIRQHLSETRRLLPIRHLAVGPRARMMRSSASKTKRVSIRSAPRSKRDDLVDLASVWLGDEVAAAAPATSSPRRPFGSRALSEGQQSSVMEDRGVESVGNVERKPGRVRPFGRQR